MIRFRLTFISILFLAHLGSCVSADEAIEIDDDVNAFADVVILPQLPADDAEREEADEEDKDKNGEDEDDAEDKDEEVDEDDPFAAILKKQPQFAAHVKQTRNNVEWIVGGDLTFAARVCEATDEEKAQIRALAKIEMREILGQVAEQMKAQFGWRAFMVAGKANGKSSREMRHAAVERILTAIYWPGKADDEKKPRQIEQWESARRERDQYNFTSHARVFVAALNERLFLDAKQRQALTKSITDCWRDEWAVYLSVIVNNPEYFPNLPKEAIKPHLTDSQYALWRSMPKSQMGESSWQRLNNRGIFQNPNGNRNPWFGDPEQAAEDAPPAIIMQKLVRVVERAAKAAKEEERADTGKAKKNRGPVSLHDLGMLGMASGASVIKQALKDGADVNEKSKDDVTPLHVAAVNGAMKNVELLLKNGADPQCEDKDGQSPADLARKQGHEKIATRIDEAEKSVKQPAPVAKKEAKDE